MKFISEFFSWTWLFIKMPFTKNFYLYMWSLIKDMRNMYYRYWV